MRTLTEIMKDQARMANDLVKAADASLAIGETKGHIANLEMKLAILANRKKVLGAVFDKWFMSREQKQAVIWAECRCIDDQKEVERKLEEARFDLDILRNPPAVIEAAKEKVADAEFEMKVIGGAEQTRNLVKAAQPPGSYRYRITSVDKDGTVLADETIPQTVVRDEPTKFVSVRNNGTEIGFMDANGASHSNPPETCWCRREVKHIIEPKRVTVPLSMPNLQAKERAAKFLKFQVRDFLRMLGKKAFKRWLDAVLDEAVKRGRRYVRDSELEAADALGAGIEADVYKELKTKKVKFTSNLLDVIKGKPVRGGRKS